MAKEKGIDISRIYGETGQDIEAMLKKGIVIPEEENVRKELKRYADNAVQENFGTIRKDNLGQDRMDAPTKAPKRTPGSTDEQPDQQAHMMGGPQRKGRK